MKPAFFPVNVPLSLFSTDKNHLSIHHRKNQ